MKELNTKEAIERLENNPEADKSFIQGIKEVMMAQAITCPNKNPVMRFFDDDGTFLLRFDEDFKQVLRNTINESGKTVPTECLEDFDEKEALAWKAYHEALALAEKAVDEAVRLENAAVALRDKWKE